MATFTVDGKHYEAVEGTNLLQAILSQSLDLPYFCWHPAMGSVGACRQCAVIQYQDAEDERGRLTMACMTDVQDGMIVSVESAHAKDFRASVIEWLMENHPHDCPVCEEGGECHLQDMTVMTGHSVRRYRDKKRTWENQDLGPFIGHEMNRCITCYRCVRFYQDYAGGKDLGAFGSRDRMFFGRVEDGVLESEFAGNLVEVCPTGVFTDKPFAQHYTRKWDLQSAASICPGCSVGCNTFASERYGELRRVHNRYHNDLNKYFICDRGRFGSHFVNSQKRIRHAAIKSDDGVFEYGDVNAALTRALENLRSDDVVGIGSPRASVEANHALRQLVGEENFCRGLSESERVVTDQACSILMKGGFRVPSVSEVEDADVTFVIGEDISNTAPRIALAIRQATRNVTYEMAKTANIPLWQDAGVRGHAQHERNPLYIAASNTTRLDDIAEATVNATSDGVAQIALQIASQISGVSHENAFVQSVAEALLAAERPLLVTGTSSSDSNVLNASAAIAWALRANGKEAALAIVGSEANTFNAVVTCEGVTLSDALTRMADGARAVILENDIYRRAPADVVDRALSGTGGLIALDVLENDTVAKASVVLPAASYAEQTGTFVNYETRAQRFYQVFQPENDILPSWRWLSSLASRIGRTDASWATVDEVTRSALAALPGIDATLEELAPTKDFRIEGDHRIARQTHRYSGRTAMDADVSVHEPKAPVDNETPYSFSMEGQNPGDQNGSVIPYSWSPGWNSNQSIFKFQDEVNGDLLGRSGGKRLFDVPSEPDVELDKEFDFSVTGVTRSATGGLVPFPVHDVFGSDELSAQSWPVAKRSKGPYVLIHPTDASALNAIPGTGVRSEALVGSFEVVLDERVQTGFVGVSVGLNGRTEIPDEGIELVVDPEFEPRQLGDKRVIAKS
ncbi:MAG: NADH-quinone oxidoreductase subunit NuoG [Gammaproteobacteria bacterium]|nr:NADH-quinone oxidoreductase subunit NuoG [Gammaproteobacteria bacterium]